jgi:ABC-type nitrate/sulfonate/bicarbonate transport system ATPase subunit
MRGEGRARPRLEAIEVAYAYRGRKTTEALDGVTLTAAPGEFIALLGPVGSGKTTFLRLVAGFLEPTRGTVLCDGVPVRGPGPERGYVFQEDAIFPWMTVRENIEFGLRARGLPRAEREAIAAELVALIGLRGYEHAYPKELSAGMTKMVEVARVLATDPAVLLLDEPFGSLDAQTRWRMQDALLGLWEQKRKTVLLVTHDADEAVYLADRVAVFSPRPGRIVAEVAVPFERPRPGAIRLSAPFLELKRTIWAALGAGGAGA